MDTCSTCKFFLEDGAEDAMDPTIKHNECRKHAPTMLSGSGTGWSSQLFPFVKPTDWCGEYQDITIEFKRHTCTKCGTKFLLDYLYCPNCETPR